MELAEKFKSIRGFFDEEQKIKQWPSKHKKKRLVIDYLLSKFEAGRTYTEPEVNEILNQHHSFEDPALLRRTFFGYKYMDRTLDGRSYWRIV